MPSAVWRNIIFLFPPLLLQNLLPSSKTAQFHFMSRPTQSILQLLDHMESYFQCLCEENSAVRYATIKVDNARVHHNHRSEAMPDYALNRRDSSHSSMGNGRWVFSPCSPASTIRRKYLTEKEESPESHCRWNPPAIQSLDASPLQPFHRPSRWSLNHFCVVLCWEPPPILVSTIKRERHTSDSEHALWTRQAVLCFLDDSWMNRRFFCTVWNRSRMNAYIYDVERDLGSWKKNPWRKKMMR